MSIIPFDDRDGFIWFDGQLTPWRDAKIHVLTHALHYASCVFEGIRVYSGAAFKLREHVERLIHSGRVLGFEVPLSVAELEQAIRETVDASGFKEAYIRPVAWRGAEQMGVAAQATKIHTAIACWEWPSYFSPEARSRGIRLQWAKWARPAPNTAPTSAKAAGLYMICTLSKHQAERDGYDDALMLDWRGRIAEATGANIFLGMRGELHTPTPDCFLDGITRQTVIELAKKRGIKVVERAIMPDELANTDEVFLTGTAAEVTPVGEIDQHHFRVGPLTQQLMADYTRLVSGTEKASAA